LDVTPRDIVTPGWVGLVSRRGSLGVAPMVGGGFGAGFDAFEAAVAAALCAAVFVEAVPAHGLDEPFCGAGLFAVGIGPCRPAAKQIGPGIGQGCLGVAGGLVPFPYRILFLEIFGGGIEHHFGTGQSAL